MDDLVRLKLKKIYETAYAGQDSEQFLQNYDAYQQKLATGEEMRSILRA